MELYSSCDFIEHSFNTREVPSFFGNVQFFFILLLIDCPLKVGAGIQQLLTTSSTTSGFQTSDQTKYIVGLTSF